ncbi:MAG: sugar transferase [Actinobacteria bacterium]|nr:sugar transferase [Actinomycetota bacterium]
MSWLLIGLLLAVGWVLRPIVGALLGQQAKGSVPDVTAAMARSAARILPEDERDRYEEEWLGELGALSEKPLSALRFAVGLRRAAYRISGRRRPAFEKMRPGVTRFSDILGAGTLLSLLAPLLLMVSIAVRISVGRTFERVPHLGKDGERFSMLRFPIEIVGRDRMGRPQRRGLSAFLVRASIHVLPNIINILRGDIGFVGPRPTPVSFREAEKIPTLSVKPGLVSWEDLVSWGGAKIDMEEARYRDRNRTLRHDLLLLLLVPRAVVRSGPSVPPDGG